MEVYLSKELEKRIRNITDNPSALIEDAVLRYLGNKRMTFDKAYFIYRSLSPFQRRCVNCLYDYKIMRTDQIARALGCRSAHIRLNELVDRGIIRKKTLSNEGNIYWLTEKGNQVIMTERGMEIKKIKEAILAVKALYHFLDIVDVLISFNKFGKVLDWHYDWEYIVKFIYQSSKYSLTPDGKGIVNNIPVMLEMQRAEKSSGASEKIEKYVIYYLSKEFIKHEASYTFPTIILVGKDDIQMGILRRAVIRGVLMSTGSTKEISKHIVFACTSFPQIVENPFGNIYEIPLEGKFGVEFSNLIPEEHV